MGYHFLSIRETSGVGPPTIDFSKQHRKLFGAAGFHESIFLRLISSQQFPEKKHIPRFSRPHGRF
jgi:hypothetical protein